MHSKLITELTDLETAFYIRKEVFVKEQNVPLDDEFDMFDEIERNVNIFWFIIMSFLLVQVAYDLLMELEN